MKSETHMSNLKLPTLTRANLISEYRLVNSKPVTLAYATQARLTIDGAVQIAHHGSTIATLHKDGSIELDTAGYDSMTTAARLHKVVVDNGTPWKVGIRQGETWLLNREAQKVRELSTARIGKSGELLEVNGHRIGGSL